MSHEVKSAPAALGFRVKSGWATAVLVVGPVQSPRVLYRRVVELSDPGVPGCRQPYHGARGKLEEDGAKVAARLKVIQRVTKSSVTQLVKEYCDLGCTLRSAGLVVGSQIDPASIKNPHIRAHALEGQLFRTVLEDAVASCGLPCSVVTERNAYSKAATVLAQSEEDLRQAVSYMGRSLGGPWRADEKMAVLAAWMVLA